MHLSLLEKICLNKIASILYQSIQKAYPSLTCCDFIHELVDFYISSLCYQDSRNGLYSILNTNKHYQSVIAVFIIGQFSKVGNPIFHNCKLIANFENTIKICKNNFIRSNYHAFMEIRKQMEVDTFKTLFIFVFSDHLTEAAQNSRFYYPLLGVLYLAKNTLNQPISTGEYEFYRCVDQIINKLSSIYDLLNCAAVQYLQMSN
jgi:hypothetical protein